MATDHAAPQSDGRAADPGADAGTGADPDAGTDAKLTASSARRTATCGHQYRDRSSACPHHAVAVTGRCLWHQARVAKSDAYVRDLLTQADQLADGDLEEAHLVALDAPGLCLPGRTLRGADLRDARLTGADLSGADLSDACLRRTNLRRARLAGANLAGADLSQTALNDADLRQANLCGAILDGTSLAGADLRGANLTGATIRSFRWSKRTRFAGATGFEPHLPTGSGEADAATQFFPSPFASDDAPDTAHSALSDPEPDADISHLYAPVAPAPAATPRADAPATADAAGTANASALASTIITGPNTVPSADALREVRSLRPRRGVLPLVLGSIAVLLALGGTGLGLWGLSLAKRGGGSDLARQVAQLTAQHDADLAELRTLQERLRNPTTAGQPTKHDLDRLRSEAADLRDRLATQSAEAARLRGADDRAALAELERDRARALAGELARANARGDRLAAILADGVDRLAGEHASLSRERDLKLVDAAQLAERDEQLAQLRRELGQLRASHETVLIAHRAMDTDLAAARATIARYLARVDASGLRDQLADDADDHGILHAVSPGSPLTLGGDYLVTLRLERPDPAAARLDLGLVVQRPASVAANPDITIILYDEGRRPLRRLAYGFPQTDSGQPFVASSASLTCSETPRFARVIVAPAAIRVGMVRTTR